MRFVLVVADAFVFLRPEIMSTVPARVVTYFAWKNNYDIVDAERLFDQLESFLGSSNGSCQVPSMAIDEAWHTFILHTKEYASYCMSRFGRFIDHVPGPAGNDSGLIINDPLCTRCSSNCRTS
jgi:hypothetical protein